jgi:putative membrane protein insertion efficiency factor
MEHEQRGTGPGSRAALQLIHSYQHLRRGSISPCRFTPSCSSYAEEAISTHGLLRGARLAIWRVLRCNPFGGHGVDLVPLSMSTGAKR